MDRRSGIVKKKSSECFDYLWKGWLVTALACMPSGLAYPWGTKANSSSLTHLRDVFENNYFLRLAGALNSCLNYWKKKKVRKQVKRYSTSCDKSDVKSSSTVCSDLWENLKITEETRVFNSSQVGLFWTKIPFMTYLLYYKYIPYSPLSALLFF